MKLMLILSAMLLPSAGLAQNQVSLDSEIFVERTTHAPNGAAQVALEAPGVVTPGDPIVFVLHYRNNGTAPAAAFVVTNPIPQSVSFAGAQSAGAEYSVDGGRSWGALAALTVRNPDGTRRPAAATDVTHIRWRLAQAIPPGGRGELRFRGVVK